jgi:uncharacterized BrkB/YihY/UPF0761 family membrane protein
LWHIFDWFGAEPRQAFLDTKRMRFKLCMFVTVFLIMAVIVVLLTWCVYLARRHQIEDFRTWVLVEGIPVVFVTTILLLLIWLVLGRM